MLSKVSIVHEEYFKVIDKKSNCIYCGSNQEWYLNEEQRLKGCGPSVAANILYYINKKRNPNCCNQDKITMLNQMEEAWKYITPRKNGIVSTSVFQKKVELYASIHKENYNFFSLDIPEKIIERPSIIQVIEFLKKGLISDVPIAFLNLHNGKENQIESWHWVTIISLRYDNYGNNVSVTICDEGICKEINLNLWLQTSKLGGGFIYFANIEQ